jgi:hypothetical protein
MNFVHWLNRRVTPWVTAIGITPRTLIWPMSQASIMACLLKAPLIAYLEGRDFLLSDQTINGKLVDI